MSRKLVGEGVIRKGDSRRSTAARHMMARRKAQWPSGFTPAGLEQIVRANRKRKGSKRTKCIHGHLFTPANTYIAPGSTKRKCKACKTLSHHRQRWARLQRKKLAKLKQDMLDAHPDKGGTNRKFILARKAYLALKGKT